MMYTLKNLLRFDGRPRVVQAIIVVLVASSVDFLWVLWMKAVSAQYILIASSLSMILGVLSLFGVMTIIERRWTYPYWICGLGLGTALAMLAKLH